MSDVKSRPRHVACCVPSHHRPVYLPQWFHYQYRLRMMVKAGFGSNKLSLFHSSLTTLLLQCWDGPARRAAKLSIKFLVIALGCCSPEFLDMILKFLRRAHPFWPSHEVGSRGLDVDTHGLRLYALVQFLIIAQYTVDYVWFCLQSKDAARMKIHHLSAIAVFVFSGDRNASVAGLWLAYLGWVPFDVYAVHSMWSHKQMAKVNYLAILIASTIWFTFVCVLFGNVIALSSVMTLSDSDMSILQRVPVVISYLGIVTFNYWTLVKLCQKIVRKWKWDIFCADPVRAAVAKARRQKA